MAIKTPIEIIPPKEFWVGDKNAKISLVEFGDYESESCSKAHEVVKKLLVEFEGKIKFNFRHFPLTKVHQRSQKAAEASLAAAQEGKFWEMHNMLFAHRKQLGTISLKLYAKEAGVNNKRLLSELVDSVYGWSVRNDLLEGLQMGVRDVPTFFINGKLYTGKPTLESMKKSISELIKTESTKVKKLQKAPAKKRA
ncbi:MAG TPA: thioredoxin domain-containing protein [Flavitalea sp.]|nr:thioredoxin domain-containing protein [Flavitalea sp.]